MNSPKRTNPLHISVQPLAGQQLPSDWNQSAVNHGGTFDRRDLSQLWKMPQWSAKLSAESVQNAVRGARLVASGV